MKKTFTRYFIIILLSCFYIANIHATTYYSTGSAALNTLANWTTARDGSGVNPANFTTAGDVFVIQNTHTMTLAATLTIGSATNNTTLQIENGGSLTANSALTIETAAVFQIDDGGTYIHNNTTAYASTILKGVENFAPNSNFQINNSSTTGPATPSNGGFGNLIINYGAINVNCTGALTDIKGNLRIVATGTSNEFRLTGATALTLNIGGDLIIEGGILNLGNGTAMPIVNLSGNFMMSGGTLTQTNTSSTSSTNYATINFSKSGGVQTFTKTGGAITVSNTTRHLAFVVPAGSTLDMGTNILDGPTNRMIDFTVQSGATLKIGSVGGIVGASTTDVTSGNIQTSLISTRSFSAGANYVYDGTAAQATGTGLTGANNLTVNNAAGVSLSAPTTVSGALNLTSGALSLGANNLTASAVTGATSANYIVADGGGALIQTVPASTDVIFPVGTAAAYAPVKVNPATTSDFAVKLTGASALAPANTAFNGETWDIAPTAASATALTLTPSAILNGVFTNVIYHWNGSSYDEIPATLTGSDYSATVSSFSPFTTGGSTVATAVAKTTFDNIYFDGTTIRNPEKLKLQVFDMTGRKVTESSGDILMSGKVRGVYVVRNQGSTLKIKL